MNERHKREPISTPALYAIIEREFRRVAPAACGTCRIPLPYWREPPDDVSSNWTVGTPAECPHKCHALIAEIVTRLWTRYELSTPNHLPIA